MQAPVYLGHRLRMPQYTLYFAPSDSRLQRMRQHTVGRHRRLGGGRAGDSLMMTFAANTRNTHSPYFLE